MSLSNFTAAMIIPTGIGASIGGFGGDATQNMVRLAAECDTLITHPNVANAAIFQQLPNNTLYVEGYGLDQFFKGDWYLQPLKSESQNKIAVVFDAGIEHGMRILHENTINAVKIVYGVDIAIVETTCEALDITIELSENGSSSGALNNPEVLLNACQSAIGQGATAIALACRMPDVDEEIEAAYKTSGGVDPIGGIEAILSHLVVSEFKIPCAHAPVFDWDTAKPEMEEILDPRTAVEFIAPTFLPCVLTGLNRSPQFVEKNTDDKKSPEKNNISVQDMGALIVPADCLGGLPVISAIEKQIPVIVVEDNQTVLTVNKNALKMMLPNVKLETLITAASYNDAAVILNQLKNRQPAKV